VKHWARADRPFFAAYGIAHFGKALFWQVAEILFIFYLTELCGLPPRTTGVVVGGALLSSALLDLAVARFLSDRLQTTVQAARLQLVGTALCAAGLLLFAWTLAIPADIRIAFVFGASLVFRGAYALLDVPQNAMLSLATRNAAQRTDLSSLRYVVGGLAAVAVAGLVAMLLKSLQLAPSMASMSVAVGGLGVVAIAGAALQARVVRKRAELSRAANPRPAYGTASLADGKAVSVLILMSMTIAATAPVFAKLEPYFAAYGLGSAMAGGVIVGATSLGGVIPQPLWIYVSGRFGHRATVRAGAVTLMLGAAAFYALAPLGMAWASLCGFVFGAGLGGVGMTLWAALADSAAQPSDRGAPPVIATFARFTFASKSAMAVSSIFVAELIARADYRRLSADGEWPLLAVMCLLPAFGAVACCLAAGALGANDRAPAPRVAGEPGPAMRPAYELWTRRAEGDPRPVP